MTKMMTQKRAAAPRASVMALVVGLAWAGGLNAQSDAPEAYTINDNLKLLTETPALYLQDTGGFLNSFTVANAGYEARMGDTGDTSGTIRIGLGNNDYVSLNSNDIYLGGAAHVIGGLTVAGYDETTFTPLAPLHVRSSFRVANETRPLVLIENQNSQVTGRNLLRLSNNGPATFRFENQAAIAQQQAGAIWGFGQRALGNQFYIATAGAPDLNLELDPNGNMTIAGALTQMSDRASKHEIVPVDGEDLLDRVAALPVSTWSYKGDQARHIGPMAQDFAAAFGLGPDDRHVAPSDVAGVGLVAVQALLRKLEAAEARFEQERSQKTGELARLREELAALRAELVP